MCESVNTQVKKPIKIMKKNTTNEITTVNNAIATTETAIAISNSEKSNKWITSIYV